jgi:hypothetical protein
MLSAVVLAFALAQAAPSESPLPATSPAPAASALPQRPSSAAAVTTASDPSLAVIVNSGSTNAAGYVLRVRANGWTTLEQAGATRHKRVDGALAARFLADLRAAGPLDALPRALCMKSVSFGSVTTVSYRGARSPDVSCPGSSAVETTLGADVDALRDAAGVSSRPARELR